MYRPLIIAFTFSLVVSILLIFGLRHARAEIAPAPAVVLSIISQIESSNRTNAINTRSGARGLHQILPSGALKDWNRTHPKEKYTKKDLLDPKINTKIASWYLEEMIPLYLRRLKIPDTIPNRLAAYNAGIGTTKKVVSKKRKMPKETSLYIASYNTILKNFYKKS